MKIAFVKPALETDAVWDPIRTCPYLGIWALASELKERGHSVRYLDEVVRGGGLSKRQMFERELIGNQRIEKDLNIDYADFQMQKMIDYESLSSSTFVEKYSAFSGNMHVHRTMVRTGNKEEETIAELAKDVPDFVGIPLIATANYLSATSLANAIKVAFPKTKIVFGGQHISSQPHDFLSSNPFVDHIIAGDAVVAMTELVEGRVTDRMIFGGHRSMRDFPLLDPDLLEPNGYPREPTYTYPTSGRKSADYMFSRGCFRKCEFCVAGSQNSPLSALDYGKVDEQLRKFREAGIEEIVVQDDAFLSNRHRSEHLKKVLSLMKKYGFFWQNNGGIEFEALDNEVTDQIILYNKSGEGKVTSLYIPFNPRSWNKTISSAKSMIERYHSNMDNLKKLRECGGIYVFTSAIIGTPEQTLTAFEDELSTDKELIRQGYIDSALPLCATMLSGTIWFENNRRNIINENDYAGYSLFATHHRTEHFDPCEIEELMVRWPKEMGKCQINHSWGSSFPSK